jgi:CRP-like cAMP-binding protein
MIPEYLEVLNNINPLSKSSRAELLKHITVRKIAKNNFILNHGEVCKHLYYINKGFVRVFYYKKGKEITEWFSGEKSFCFSISSYFEQTPSDLIIETLEDSEIILLSKEGLSSLRRSNLEVANLIIGFFTGSLIGSQKRMESLQFETAKQRYSHLLRDEPQIVNKVPLQYIASFLGITQETLSRIRAQI